MIQLSHYARFFSRSCLVLLGLVLASASQSVNSTDLSSMSWSEGLENVGFDGNEVGLWPPFFQRSAPNVEFNLDDNDPIAFNVLSNSTWDIYLYHYVNVTPSYADGMALLNSE